MIARLAERGLRVAGNVGNAIENVLPINKLLVIIMLCNTGGRNNQYSLEHEYWKRYYAQKYRDMGYKVTLEAPRRQGRVDVLAVKPGENGSRRERTRAGAKSHGTSPGFPSWTRRARTGSSSRWAGRGRATSSSKTKCCGAPKTRGAPTP